MTTPSVARHMLRVLWSGDNAASCTDEIFRTTF